MSEIVRTGRVWKFGDNIDTDVIMPASAFKGSPEERRRLAFSAIRPGWAEGVKAGDLILAGQNFGVGSGRPIGAVLRACGIEGVVAESINGLGLRNFVNFSLPAMSCEGVLAAFEEGDVARVDFVAGTVENVTRGVTLKGRPLVPLLVDIVEAGGVIPMLVKEGYVQSEAWKVTSA